MPRVSIEQGADEPSIEGVQAIVQSTELADVRLDQVEAGPVSAVGTQVTAEVQRGEPQFAFFDDDTRLVVRLMHTMVCTVVADEAEDAGQDAGDRTTTMRVWHAATFNVTEDLTVEMADLAMWIQSNVYFLAYPYVRQYFTALTAALGLPPVVLGYLRREELPGFQQDEEVADDTGVAE